MLIKTLAISLLALAASTAAHAVSAIDNVSTTGNPAGTQPLATSGTSIGVSFITGADAEAVSEVVFPQILGSSDGYSSSETFSLYTNNPLTNMPLAASPVTFTLDNTQTLTFGQPGFGQTTATPSSPMILTGGTRYWLVLGNASAVTWDYLPSSTYMSSLGYTLPTTNTSFTGSSYYTLNNGPQQFVLNVNAVPEPSTFGMMALGSLGLFFVVRRTRSGKAV